MDIWHQYTGNLSWLRERTFFLSRHGSHAYGTNLPGSDEDFRGVCIPPKEYFYGYLQHFEQATQKDPDLVVFDLRKFFGLAAEANPNALEILFTDPSDHLVVTDLGERLLQSRELFLSRKVKHTFSGYAISQLRRIETHYRWLKDPPKAQPTRAEFDLPERTVIPADQLAAAEAAIRKQVDRWSWKDLDELDPAQRQMVVDQFNARLLELTQWSHDEITDRTWNAASKHLGFDTNFIELLDLERRYTAKMREWQQYQEWKKTRNPARAALEAKFGYDTKHAMHLVRLLRMAREILTTGQVLVRRPDREELLAIRGGAWSYETLIEYAKMQDAELSSLAEASPLPHAPNRPKLDAVCVELHETMLRRFV